MAPMAGPRTQTRTQTRTQARTHTRAMARTLSVALAIFALDQATKVWVIYVLDLPQRLSIPVVPPYLTFQMAWNRGVNFGLFAGGGDAGRWILVALAVGISVALLIWVRRARGWLVPVATGAIVGGAIGNALDRVTWGAVADFLNMSCCGIVNPFSFNVADIAIFAGAAGLILFTGGGPDAAGPQKAT